MKPLDRASLLPSLPPGSNILIIRLRSLGDVVLLTPALAAVHAWRPDLKLSVLVEPACRAALEGNPTVAEIIVAEGFVATAQALRRRHFPVVFNQHGGPRSALLTAATGAGARICWKGKQFGIVYNIQVPDAQEYFGTLQVHTVEQRMAQFYCTGLPKGEIPPARVYPQADALAAVGAELLRHGISDGEKYAVVQPSARQFTMRWPAERFLEIAGWLRDAHGIRAVFNLGPGERGLLGDARARLPGDGVVLDSLDVRELIALISRARLFIGNDSGPVHLAAALGIPSVVIYGSSSSVHWRPWRIPHRVVQNAEGILAVTVEQVREACDGLLCGAD